jgi:hypothetical protein
MRRFRVGGPLRYVWYAYLGLWLLGGTHSTGWRVLGVVVLAGAAPFLAVSIWQLIRAQSEARSAARSAEQPGDGPVLGIAATERGEWDYSPAVDGTTEIELRLRGRRYTATFPASEREAYRTVIAGLTETLNDGAPVADVNAAFRAAIGREPFRDRGPIPVSLGQRLMFGPHPPDRRDGLWYGGIRHRRPR